MRCSMATSREAHSTQPWQVALAWLVVGLPLLWGVFETLKKAAALFR